MALLSALATAAGDDTKLRVRAASTSDTLVGRVVSQAGIAKASADGQPLKIAYPPDGGDIDLGLTSGGAVPLALKALGGAPPLTWMVNGAPVLRDEPRRNAAWAPDGAGFVRVTVMDSTGASDSVSVRLE